MTISLYSTSDRKDKIYKSVSPVQTNIDVSLKNATDILNPTFILQSNNFSGLITANYLYADSFKRWYFINNWTAVTNEVFEIHCSVDVLYTYKDGIGECAGIVDRSQAPGEPYIDDKLLLEKASRSIRTLTFDGGDASAINGLSLILVTANTN